MLHLLLSFFVSTAFAQNFKDWKLVKEADAVLQTQVCRISTSVSTMASPIELSLSFPIQFDKPPTMYLKAATGSGVQKAVIPVSKTASETLFPLSVGADGEILWYAPLNLVSLVNIVAQANSLPVQLLINGQVVSGKISLSGSTAAINAVSTCLKNKDILAQGFQKELNTALGDTVLGQDQTPQQLYSYVEGAFTLYLEKERLSAELIKVRASMKPLLVQEKDTTAALSSAQSKLDKATAAMDATAAKVQRSETRLSQIPSEIQDLQARKPEADRVMAEKWAIYQPLKQQADLIQKEIDTAAASIRQADSAIAQRRRTISEGESSINSYRNEASSLSSRNDRLDREIQSLERQAWEIRNELSRYSVEAERRRILNSDSRYQRDLREVATLRQQERTKSAEQSRAASQLQSARTRLADCRRVEKADCSLQQQDVQRAQTDLERLNNELRQVRGELRRTERDIQSAEQNAQWQAQRGHDEIAGRLQRVESEIQNLESERRQNLARINSIYQDYIPRLEFEIRQARSEIPGWESRRAEAVNNRSQATQRLADFKAANDFVRIENEYVAAKATVDGIVKGIADRQAEEKKHNADLKVLRPQLEKQKTEVAKLTPPRDNLQKKLDGIQAQLAPLRTRDAEIVNLQTQLKPQYDEIRKLYQTLFKKLLQA